MTGAGRIYRWDWNTRFIEEKVRLPVYYWYANKQGRGNLTEAFRSFANTLDTNNDQLEELFLFLADISMGDDEVTARSLFPRGKIPSLELIEALQSLLNQWIRADSKDNLSAIEPELMLLLKSCKSLLSLLKLTMITLKNTSSSLLDNFQPDENTNGLVSKRAAVYDNLDLTQSSPSMSSTGLEKRDSVRSVLLEVVKKNVLFKNYLAHEQKAVVEAFQNCSAIAGEQIIKQGDQGSLFYVIESGSVIVSIEGQPSCSAQTLGRGGSFGELALIYNTPRAATVTAAEDCVLWTIDRATCRTILTNRNRELIENNTQLIRSVKLLGHQLSDILTPGDLSKLVSSLEVKEFDDSTVIIRQHATGDCFYVISQGSVEVWNEDARDADGQPTKLATLQAGEYFGEKALLADDKRLATCTASGPVTCLCLHREDFIALLGPWIDIVKGADSNGRSVEGKKDSETATPRTSLSKSAETQLRQLTDFSLLSTLGVGAFGKVLLARNKSTGQLVAIKAQSKAHIIAQGMQKMIQGEMDIMRSLEHPCIAKLYGMQQDAKFIYFYMELLSGGEFFGYLQEIGLLPEERAKFYAASVVSAFDAFHRRKIAYRDLKPENMVLDSRGYVKIVDMGLAKQISSGQSWTMCGTPDYMAPEIVLSKGHDYAVDYWALGVLLFEILHGWPPFYHSNPLRVYEKIVSGKFKIPDNFSKSAEDLIRKLLVEVPAKRLGYLKGGVADIMKHKWFGAFDWMGLLAGRIQPEYIPKPLQGSEIEEENSSLAKDFYAEVAEAEECDWMIKEIQ